jgi:hypothetical protein
MANDILYKASLHLGASPQNKRSSLLYKTPTVGNRQQIYLSTFCYLTGLEVGEENRQDGGERHEPVFPSYHKPSALKLWPGNYPFVPEEEGSIPSSSQGGA